MLRTTRKQLTLAILGVALALIPFARQASAQSTSDRTANDSGATNTRTNRDEGFNYGWLGLLGLAGLAGLMPRKNHTIASHRPGDTNVR